MTDLDKKIAELKGWRPEKPFSEPKGRSATYTETGFIHPPEVCEALFKSLLETLPSGSQLIIGSTEPKRRSTTEIGKVENETK